ncbi:MAG: Flp pilus assembly protein CpaB [Halocynthiibacter sp.]
MRLVFGLVLALGLGLAGFAVYMINNYIAERDTALKNAQGNTGPQIELTKVYIVVKPMRYGQPLLPENVALKNWPKFAVTNDVFTTEEELFPKDAHAHRSVLRSMERGEVLMKMKVTEPGEEAGISSKLSRGKRAFSIDVNETSAVSGFLRPEDYVDIYWTGNVNEREVTRLIQSRVRLIAINQSANVDIDKTIIADTVTVEGTPKQVAELTQAQASGLLTLSLVGSADDSRSENVEIGHRELFGEKEIKQIEEKEKCTIRTRKGVEIIEIPIPCPQQ